MIRAVLAALLASSCFAATITNVSTTALIGPPNPTCSQSDPSSSTCEDGNFFVSAFASATASNWTVSSEAAAQGDAGHGVALASASASVTDNLTFLGGSGGGSALFTFIVQVPHIFLSSEFPTYTDVCFFGTCYQYAPGVIPAGFIDNDPFQVTITEPFVFGVPLSLNFESLSNAHDGDNGSVARSTISLQGIVAESGSGFISSDSRANYDSITRFTPEPASCLLVGAGLLGCLLRVRKLIARV